MLQTIQKSPSKLRILPMSLNLSKRISPLHKYHKRQIITNTTVTFNSILVTKPCYPPRTSNSLHSHFPPHASSFLASSDPSQFQQKCLLSHTNLTSRQQ